MDVDARIVTILHECRWVRDQGTAVRLIPALAAEAPPFVLLPQRGGEVRASVPVLCLPMVAVPVVRTIIDAVEGKGGGFETLEAAEVAQDPLAAAVAEEGAPLSEEAAPSPAEAPPAVAVRSAAGRCRTQGPAHAAGGCGGVCRDFAERAGGR